VSTTSSGDLLGSFDVRLRALVSVRVAVTVAVNQALGRGLKQFRRLKVQVKDMPP
jgi:hypothetical protein